MSRLTDVYIAGLWRAIRTRNWREIGFFFKNLYLWLTIGRLRLLIWLHEAELKQGKHDGRYA
jgi:hypothetical protein